MQALTPRRELWLLLTLAGVQFTHIVEFMVIVPLGPQLSGLLQISDQQFGILISAYTFAAGASGLLAATYIDRFDRKKLLLALYLLFVLATVNCGLAQNYHYLLGARVASGVFGGVLSALVQTIVGQSIPFARRGRAMGIVMSAFSAASALGVPVGLLLATHFSWHTPFFIIASFGAALTLLAWFTLPAIPPASEGKRGRGWFVDIEQVLADRGHRRGMLFSALMVAVGFVSIPYITLYMQANVGIMPAQLPYIYLCGGLATLVSARFIGVLADRFGKENVFVLLALVATLPLLLLTSLPALPFGVVLLVNISFFVIVSGRMIPGMALLTATANPGVRGTFMTLNAAVQSVAMGAAAWVGGLLIHRDALGMIAGYWKTGLLGATLSLGTVYLVRRLLFYEETGTTEKTG